VKWTFDSKHASHTVGLGGTGPDFAVSIGDKAYRARVIDHAPPRLTLLIDDHHVVEADVVWKNDHCQLTLDNIPYAFDLQSKTSSTNKPEQRTTDEVTAPLPGRIIDMLVSVGDSVRAGQPVCIIEAMKMQNEICAPRDGHVKATCAAAGDTVEVGARIITLQGG
jgi:glutaconyl-CoA/methylmalonyl-CoA decarboxylase subunit gamma